MRRFLPSLLTAGCCFLPVLRIQAQVFTVSLTHGQAEIGKDRASYQTAVVNSNYSIPAWGKTEDNSSLTIAFNPQNRFRLLPNSEAQVTTGGEGDSNSAWHRVVSLKFGEAKFDHNAGAAPTVHLDCETPTAVCGAVGTEYDVNATDGVYSVSSGRISVTSDQEGALSLTTIEEGGNAIYNPGRENTYSKGSFTGSVHLNGNTFHASNANFTIAKKLDSASETAVHIASGTLGGFGPGDYLMDGSKMVPVAAGSKAASLHPQYLAAAQVEGTLSVQRAAALASNRPWGHEADLRSATAEATRLRKELFERETVREINKQVTQQVIQNAAQQAAAAAAAEAARAAMRGGH